MGKQVYTLTLGGKCFWNGHKMEIVGADGDHLVLYSAEPSCDVCYTIPVKAVQPLAEDVFKVGDKVRSRHTFKGTVTGFEPETNRVVCISDRIDEYDDRRGAGMGNRTRWAYKIDELETVREFTFEINRVYPATWTHKRDEVVMVRALQHPVNANNIFLYRVDNGKLFTTVLPRTIAVQDLQIYGLNILETE